MESNNRIIKIMLTGGVVLMLACILIAVNVTGYRTSFGRNRMENELTYFKDFSMVTLDGETIGTEDFNKYDLIVLNGWAPWCNPCKAEMPDLEELSKEMKERGVLIAGVAADYDDASDGEEYLGQIRDAVTETGITYPVFLPDQAFLEQVVPTMNGAYPGTWFIREDGTVVGFVSGRRSIDEWRELINTYLEEGEQQ